jgi:para-nitrobenzyl esterase
MKKWLVLSVLCVVLAVVWGGYASYVQAQGPGLPEKIAVQGGTISGQANGDVLLFKGIPYVKAPVGPLRWKPPQAVEAWEGVRQTTEYGAACLQPDLPGLPMKHAKRSEDCLYLNVWTAAKSADEKRPVMVWIHGGGNVIGSAEFGTPSGTNPEPLAKQGVVVVSFNYRLGPFGYFAHPLLSKESPNNASGNYGLLDQIAALKWVQDNIKAFGGDAGNVTIFGESAGSHNVGYLMASPLAKGLFHRGIGESGSVYIGLMNRHLREAWYGMEPMERQGERVTKDLGCADAADPVAALRALSAEQVLRGSRPVMGPPGNVFPPVIDGWVLPDDVMTIFDQGKQNKVPLIAGANGDEMTFFIPAAPFPTVDAYRGFLKSPQACGAFGDDVFVLYPAKEPPDILRSFRDQAADSFFVGPTRNLVRVVSKTGGKAYMYHFTMTWPGGPLAAMGAFHSGELPFVMNDLERVKNVTQTPFEAKHQALADTMSAYWVQFARTGNPNKDGLPEWPAYDATKDQYMEFGEAVKVGQGLRKEKLDLWERFNDDKRKGRAVVALVADKVATPRDYTNLQGGKWEIRGFTNPMGQRVDLSLQIDRVEGDKLAGTYARAGDANDVTPFSTTIGRARDGNPGFVFSIPYGAGSMECSLREDGSLWCNNGATLKRTVVLQK